ncbi:L-threonine 3-O-phosphate decarboxylase [Methanosarcina lacustris Z-7289]|uniref:threonine-phosphate decarboxylase n=1 Tax=Methanosarcina lacustris Z-7289 TaxID=1434111 RepID=A0A0E3S407_9EURY|nr:threonine-phosphate decarboxylase CobD [Methanosarcina lacustris]AKB75749.1 L-threonine 3-O-phosphate decarboxylase [Methanosarcina lacustris Z-7289]
MSEQKSIPLREHLLALKPCLHGGLIQETSETYGIPESEIIDFSANFNPLGSPFDYPENELNFGDIIEESLGKLLEYPDNRYVEFREAAARFVGLGVTPQNIIPGNGSTEIVRLVVESVVEKGDTVLLPWPTFGEYEMQCRIVGAEPVYPAQDGVDNLSDEMLDKAKILFICNPNNPTGKLRSRDELKALAERCRVHKTLLYVDEAFIELSDPSKSVADLPADNDYVFVMRSLTKDFAIPGVRMGFGIASPDMADILNTARLSWNLGAIANTIGTALLNIEGGVDSPYLKKAREMVLKEGETLKAKLDSIRGFEAGEVNVNFIFVNISKFMLNSSELAARLASRGVLIRDCVSFHGLGKYHIRVAVKTEKENDRLIAAIGEVITEWGREQAKNELQHVIEKASEEGIGGRKTCEYYPCHFEGQNCTFCFCPFYPCENEKTGGKWIKRSRGGRVWSCVDCHLVHKTEIAQKILDCLMQEGDTEELVKVAWKKVMEPIL